MRHVIQDFQAVHKAMLIPSDALIEIKDAPIKDLYPA
jgi:hypothetical protein